MQKRIVQFGTNRAETAGLQLFAGPIETLRIDGYCSGAANSFLQLFDLKVAPAANAIPKKSLQVFFNDGFSYVFAGDDIGFVTGLYLGLSTDETKFVADGSGTKVSGDLTLQDYASYKGKTPVVVGDYTTAVALLQVWTQANFITNPTLTLQRLEVTNNNGSDVIFCVIARDASTLGARVVWASPVVAASATADFYFGTDGISPLDNSGGVLYNGCRVVGVLASVAAAAPLSLGLPAVVASADFLIKATAIK